MRLEREILISALVSTYNAERFMRGLLEDLEAQTLRDHMEIVIIDSASPEYEGEIVREFQQRFDNIVYQRTPERENAHVSVNRAFALSRGRYVTPAATDDRHHPRAFERLVAELETHPEVGLVYADAAVTQTENETLDDASRTAHFLWPEFDPRLLFDVCYIGPHPVYRRAMHEKYGGFDESMTVAGDYEFWLRLVAAGERFRHVPEVLSLYLQNPRGNEYGNPRLCDEESEMARLRYWREEWGPRPRPGTCFLFPVTESASPEPATAPAASELVSRPFERPATDAPAGDLRANEPTQRAEPPATTADGATPNDPVVSVILPTYDRPEWLRRAVSSALAQTFGDIELIVVNDGGAPVDALLSELDPHGRVQSIRLGQNRERSAARNAGLAIARGRYVAYLDDDDWWEPDHLEPLVEKLEQTGALGIYSDARTVVETLQEGRYQAARSEELRLPDFDRRSLLVGNFVPTPCLLHRRDALATAGVFDPSLKTHEDWDLWIRLTASEPFLHEKRTSANISWRTDGSSTTSADREDFPVTAEKIHRRYASEAAARPGVPEAQERYVAGLRARLPRRDESAATTAPESAAPDRVEAHAAEARLAITKGNLEEAHTALTKLFELSPEHAEGWLLRGVLTIQRLDYGAAADAFAEALRHGADSRRAELGMAMAALGRGRNERAWSVLRGLSDRHPADDEVTHWLLRAACVRERFGEAVAPLQRYLEAHPDDASMRFALAGLLIRLGRLDEAAVEHERIRARAPEFGGLPELAAALEQAGARVSPGAAEPTGAPLEPPQ